jgi:ribonuclease BN (tRNA processing enzyme)
MSRRNCNCTPGIPTATASKAWSAPSSIRPIPSTGWTTKEEHEGFVKFFAKADLVIFDAMYSLAEAVSVKADWGHSSNVVGVELCQAAKAKRLALFHHEPMNDDNQLSRLLAETRRLEEITRHDHNPLEVISAYDGLTVAL